MSRWKFFLYLFLIVSGLVGFSYLSPFITDQEKYQYMIIIGGTLIPIIILTIILFLTKGKEILEEPEQTEFEDHLTTWADTHPKEMGVLKDQGYFSNGNEKKKRYFWETLAIIFMIVSLISLVGFGYLIYEGKFSDSVDLKCEATNITIPECPSINCPNIPICPTPIINVNPQINITSTINLP